MAVRQVPAPEEVQMAIMKDAVLNDDHLRAMIEIDARALGMSPDEAILRAKRGTLPKGPIADDLVLLLGVADS